MMGKIATVVGVCGLIAMMSLGCSKTTVVAPTQGDEDHSQPTQQVSLVEQVLLHAYDVDEDEEYTTIYELAPDQALDAYTVVEAYQQEVMLNIYGKAVAINQIALEDGKLTIDFSGESINQLNLDSGVEGQFWGDLAQSVIANLPQIVEIYYTIDKGDFATGHLWFGKDEPFWRTIEAPSN